MDLSNIRIKTPFPLSHLVRLTHVRTLANALSFWTCIHSMCIMLLSYPGKLSIQYVISGRFAILLYRGPFSLRCVLLSQARLFSLCFFMVLGHYPPRLRPTEFVSCALIPSLSIWSTRCALILRRTRSVCGLHFPPGLAHSICTPKINAFSS